MTRNQKIIAGAAGGTLLLLAGLMIWNFWPGDDKIEEGKVYPLAMTYLAHLKMPSSDIVEGRMFDFVDRNVVKSKPAPLFDGRGQIVWENPNMKPGTVKVIRQKRPGMVVEGVSYPPQEWLEWHFNYNDKSPQKFVPTIIVKK